MDYAPRAGRPVLAYPVLLAALGSADALPLAVSIGVAGLGSITLVELIPARHGSRAVLHRFIVA